MHIKQFREQQVRVQDPLRPNKRIFETRLNPSGGHEIVDGPNIYVADPEGWIEVPDELGERLKKARGGKGEKFYTPDEVDEEVVAGRIKPDPDDADPAAKPAPKKAAAAAKS